MKKILFLAVMMQFLSAFNLSAQADKHIDPSAKKHKHTLSIGRNVGTAFTIDQAKKRFAQGTKILQECNNVVDVKQDVACKVTVEPGAAMGTWGAAGDGLDIINTQAELTTVMNNNSFTVKVVTSMPGDGTGLCGAAGSILACATTAGTASIVIVSGLTDEQWGEVIIHEFGHTRGLAHRNTPGNPIMHATTLGNTEVNDVEAAAFHTGGTEDGDNRPVDILFLIDDTGSMGEEIGGVRNFLTLLLGFFPGNSCGTVFQLVTFKDNVSPREPTTDLNVIKNQVAALFASGGGDCPEASVEAINASKDKVKDKGLIFLATDANPHAGLDIPAAAASLAARGIIFSTLLSGECFGSTAKAADGTPAYNSDNHDLATEAEATSVSAAAEFSSATEAYSFICEETGGVFAFVPQVNSGIPSDKAYYENIGYNIILGGLMPSITSLQPNKAPVGSTIGLTISASKTHFTPTTSLQFNDAGVVASNITFVSETKLIATVNVGSGVPLGFKDITATTILSDGSTETAKGVGLINITTPPSTPTILSIAPNSATLGQTLTVKITGINTHFSNSSIPDLGSDITIESVNAISNTELDAKINIDPAAPLGFHNVIVTTGSEIATENVPGPFLVIGSSCSTPPSITAIVGSDANTFCNSLKISPVIDPGANGGPFTAIWTNNANVISTDLFLHLTNANPNGIYSVVVKDVNGCASNAFNFEFNNQNYISSYNIFAFKEVKLNGNNVVNGAIGVQENKGKIELKNSSKVPSPGFVKASVIKIDMPSGTPNRYLIPAKGVLIPTVQKYAGNPAGLPSYTAPANSNRTFGNAKEVVVKKNAKATLTGNNYGKIHVETGGHVIFTNATIDIQELKLHNGNPGYLTKLSVNTDASIRISKSVSIGQYSNVNGSKYKLTFYMNDNSSDVEKFTVQGKGTQVVANVMMLKGKMKVTGDNKETGTMIGQFIVDKLDGDGSIAWHSFDCSSTPAKVVSTTTNGKTEVRNSSENKPFRASVYPNPSPASFRIAINSTTNDLVTVSIKDVSGRTVETTKAILQNGIINVGSNLPKGIYFAYIIQGKERSILKLVKQ